MEPIINKISIQRSVSPTTWKIFIFLNFASKLEILNLTFKSVLTFQIQNYTEFISLIHCWKFSEP